MSFKRTFERNLEMNFRMDFKKKFVSIIWLGELTKFEGKLVRHFGSGNQWARCGETKGARHVAPPLDVE